MSEFNLIDDSYLDNEEISSVPSIIEPPVLDDNYDIENSTSLVPYPNTIDLGYNTDGSKKYSFDSIYKDKQLIETAKSFYEERDGIEFENDEDVVDEYINDRTWKQANVTSALVELNQVKNQMDVDQLKRLRYLTEYWYNMPNFWEEGGRSASSAIFQNIKAGILDWTNVASLGVGSLATKTVGKEAVKLYGKNELKKQILKLTGKATVATTAFDARVFAGAALAIQTTEMDLGLRQTYDFKRTGTTAILGGGLSMLPNGFANYASLKLISDINYSPKKVDSPTLKKTLTEIDDDTGVEKEIIEEAIDFDELGKSRVGKDKKVILAGEGNKKSLLWQIQRAKQKVFDKDNFYKIYQKIYTGVTGSVRGSKAAFDVQKPVTKAIEKAVKEGRYQDIGDEFLDPSQLTYFKRRDMAASSLRSEDFLENGVQILKLVVDPKSKKIKSEYVSTGNRGLEKILADFDNYGEGDIFVKYILAKRSQYILEQNDKILKKNPLAKVQDTPFTPKGKIKLKKIKGTKATAAEIALERQRLAKKNIEELIDYAEMTPDKYSAKYTKDGVIPNGRNADLDYVKGSKEWKAFFDDLLDYSVSKGMHSADEAVKMKAANPYGYIPMRTVNKLEIQAFDPGTTKTIGGISGAGTTKKGKKFVKGRKPIEKTVIAPLVRTSVEYTHHSIKAADANAEKLAFYNSLDKINALEAKYIAEPAKLTSVKNTEILVEPLLKKLKAQGIEIDEMSAAKLLKETAKEEGADSKMFVMGFHSSMKDAKGQVFDVFYRNGERQIYKINSALLQDTLNTLKGPSNAFEAFVSKAFSVTKYVGRLPARAITYSPPFVAFNFIRDSLSATINSAFGVNPYYSAKGFMLTFGGDATGQNMNKYVNAFRRNNEFRKAIVNGLGQSTRLDVEKYAGIDALNELGKSSATAWYRKTINIMKGSVFGRGAKGYAELVSRIEYASRYAEFMAAQKYGLSSTAAAIAGREVSTDFAMRGSSVWLNNYASVTMFFNAGLQGFYRGARNFVEGEGIGKQAGIDRITKRRAGIIAGQEALGDVSRFGDINARALMMMGATVVGPEILSHMRNRDLPEYQDVPDEVKMLNLLYPIFEEPQKDGSHLHLDGTRKVKHFFALPKPYDFGVFGNVATGIYEGVMKKSPGLAAEYIGQSFLQIMPGLAAPTLANPRIPIMLNKNWLDDEILPHGYRRLPANQQIKSNTRKSAQYLSDFIQMATGKAKQIRTGSDEMVYRGTTISPIILDYIMAGYFTGIASYPLDLFDAALYDEDKYGEKPTRRGDVADIAKEPWSIVTRRFKVDVPVKNSKSLQTFYDIRNKARKLKAGADYNLSDLESVLGFKFKEDLQYTEVQEGIYVSNWFDTTSRILKSNRDQITIIKNSKDYKGFPDVSPVEYTGLSEADIKRKDIDFLTQLNNDIANSVLKDLRNANFETIERDIFGYTKYDETKTEPKKQSPSVIFDDSGSDDFLNPTLDLN